MFPKQGLACLFLISVLSNMAPVLALASPETAAADTKLSAMEVKLFTHEYKKEAASERLARIERFVFGGTKTTGTFEERVNALAGTLNLRNVVEAPYLPKNRPFSDWTPTANRQMNQALSQRTQTQGQTTLGALANVPSSSYPRVTELEQRLFGQDYASEPIATRLNRLEVRAYGRTSKSTDLAVRVDNLVAYVVPTLQLSPARVRMASYTPNRSTSYSVATGSAAGNYRSNFYALYRSDSPAPSRSPELVSISRNQQCTVVDQIEYLENATFGKIRANKTLQRRVDALEEKFYGAPHAEGDKDLSGRVAQLWTTANSGNHANVNRTGA